MVKILLNNRLRDGNLVLLAPVPVHCLPITFLEIGVYGVVYSGVVYGVPHLLLYIKVFVSTLASVLKMVRKMADDHPWNKNG